MPYRAIVSRVPAVVGIVPFHPTVAVGDLPDLPLLRDLDPIPRQRNQPLHKQFTVVPRRPWTSNSNSNNIRKQRNAQEIRGGSGGVLTGRRQRRRGRGRSGRGSASPPARARPVRRPGWGTCRPGYMEAPSTATTEAHRSAKVMPSTVPVAQPFTNGQTAANALLAMRGAERNPPEEGRRPPPPVMIPSRLGERRRWRRSSAGLVAAGK